MATEIVVEPLGRTHLSALSRFAHRQEVPDLLFDVANPSRAYIGRALAAVEAARAQGQGFVFAVIVPRAGIIGVCRVDRDLQRRAVGELGYGIGAEFRGRGHASAAAAIVLDYAFATGGIEIVEARCSASNPASIRVLEKLGFVTLDSTRTEAAGPLMSFELHRSRRCTAPTTANDLAPRRTWGHPLQHQHARQRHRDVNAAAERQAYAVHSGRR